MINTYGLSKREEEVALLLLEGKSNKQIALALDISESTVEFHLTKMYLKLSVGSRAEAILRLSPLRKTPVFSAGNLPAGYAGTLHEISGESPVENIGESAKNINRPTMPKPERPEMTRKHNLALAKFLIPIAVGIILTSIVIIGLHLSALKTWNQFARECEYPDVSTVGQTIARSNASGLNVHGQFGTINAAPWSAQPGYVIYRNINTPKVDQLYLKVRYSKNSPSSVPILVYLDDEQNPRASFYPRDQRNWNQFAWAEPIFLGNIESGVHSIRFATSGQQYGVADLDKFVLTAGPSP